LHTLAIFGMPADAFLSITRYWALSEKRRFDQVTAV
jgi:hypothetical protein